MIKKGFTLIELLVVISIIAILVGILLPSLSIARDRTRDTVCRTNLSGIGRAIELYRSQYNSLPWAHGLSSFFNRELETLPENIKYVKDVSISKALEEFSPKKQFNCPADTGPSGDQYDIQDISSATLKKEFHGQTYFEHEETSYEYVPDYWLLQALYPSEYQETLSSCGSTHIIMGDFEIFHRGPSSNELFIDGHVNSMFFYKKEK